MTSSHQTLFHAIDGPENETDHDNVTFESSSLQDFTETGRTLPEILIIELLLCSIIIITICGNLLVCVTIATDRKLHNTTNHFILSLSVTDLLLGGLVLPISAYNAVQSRWPFGHILCNVYVSADVMLCTVSILTLFAISLDRYFAVVLPLRYHQTMRRSIVCKINAGIWAFSSLVAFLPIQMGWNTTDGAVQNTRALPSITNGNFNGGFVLIAAMSHSDKAVCAFELNAGYTLAIALGTYFAPLAVMCGVYLKILTISRRQAKAINGLGVKAVRGGTGGLPNSAGVRRYGPCDVISTSDEGGDCAASSSMRLMSRSTPASATPSMMTLSPNTNEKLVFHSKSNSVNSSMDPLSPTTRERLVSHPIQGTPSMLTVSSSTGFYSNRSSANKAHSMHTISGRDSPSADPSKAVVPRPASWNSFRLPLRSRCSGTEKHPKDAKLVSERKSTVTLAIVVAAFAICWVPYFVLFVAKPFVGINEVNPHLDLLVLWLGYVNSSINPFVYAFYNAGFRDGFRRVLCRYCCCVGRWRGAARGGWGGGRAPEGVRVKRGTLSHSDTTHSDRFDTGRTSVVMSSNVL